MFNSINIENENGSFHLMLFVVVDLWKNLFLAFVNFAHTFVVQKQHSNSVGTSVSRIFSFFCFDACSIAICLRSSATSYNNPQQFCSSISNSCKPNQTNKRKKKEEELKGENPKKMFLL